MAFYDLMFNQCQRRAAIEKYTGDEYIKHNPHVADGKEGFIEYFERLARDQPGKITHFKRAITEGNLMIPRVKNAYGAPDGRFALTPNIRILEQLGHGHVRRQTHVSAQRDPGTCQPRHHRAHRAVAAVG